MKQTFGYARVSTADQNTDTQIDALQEYGCDRIFQEKISGLSVQRPALDKMLSLLRPGDTVVVSRFSRLGRSRDHLISLIGSFCQRGIIFKALDLGIDSATPSGKLVIGIFAALAEYDREMILEKTRAGQLLAKARGKHIGRPSGVNRENYTKVRKALEKGLSVNEIANLTGISLSSVKRYRKAMSAAMPQG
ncbi:recombinase family protein [Salmonirosea aquatica]|uniref:Helix-turn-helix domain-containing protein n=1 Tax=Salmonirosea aquatica TaxID=2654236 RepID=A0A7C9BGS8_9BACT|nr:helix-turn-helix domain-containing protein [Cytophagaceae bacterium SJW1-29]